VRFANDPEVTVTHDDLGAARLGVLAALRDGDAALAHRLLVELMHDGYDLPYLLDEVLAPIQVDTGHRWELGDISIPEEHASTAALETLVSMLAGAFGQPVEADTVVIACAEGDNHTLPARMAAAVLTYNGYHTLFLGNALPADDLGDYLDSVAASAMVLSCTHPAALLGARSCVAAAHHVGVPVLVGGRAFAANAERAARIGADGLATRLRELPDLLQSWTPDPATSESAAVPVAPSMPQVLDRRVEVARAALGDVLDHDLASEVQRRRLLDDAVDLVTTLAVADHLDDPTMATDQATWLARHLESRTGRPVTPHDLLDRAADAMSTVDPRAASIAVRARQLLDG
jgi:methanogenic corrinoid protein MtbC1